MCSGCNKMTPQRDIKLHYFSICLFLNIIFFMQYTWHKNILGVPIGIEYELNNNEKNFKL